MIAGAYLVDAFPILKHIPEWMPGAEFKRKASEWRRGLRDAYNIPFNNVSKAFIDGTAVPSFTASWLSRINNVTEHGERETRTKAVKDVAGTAFVGAYETTSATLLNFVLHMITHPDVQRRAQEELDRVIGRDRLPDFEDKESLPYMNALYKEVLRWHPVVPLGAPHRVTADDDYKGMWIPKGSIVFSNIWAMSRNERDYTPDPDAFRPERFLEADVRDPGQYVFGFGRRICPGRYFAENSVFICMCYILQAFWIGKVVNEDGSEKPIEPHWESGITVHLVPFPASFKLRFAGAEKLISSIV